MDKQEFDLNSEIDLNLTLEENKRILRDKIKNFVKPYKEITIIDKDHFNKKEIIPDYPKGMEEEKNRELLEISEKEAEKEFNKSLDKIHNSKTSEFLEEKYFILNQYTKMVALDYIDGMLVYGNTGIGKTHQIMKVLNDEGKKFILVSGHLTTLKLYSILYEHRDEIIILDDMNILNSEINLNMLKACLNDKCRIVQYHTSSDLLKVPNKFIFNGKLIIILNERPFNNENLRAVESRVLTYELYFSYEELIKIMAELIKQDYKTLKYSERKEIFNFIKENTSPATNNFNLRKLFQCYEFYLFDVNKWKRLSLSIFESDEEIESILKGMGWKDWCNLTGKHRATYYRLKKKVAKSH